MAKAPRTSNFQPADDYPSEPAPVASVTETEIDAEISTSVVAAPKSESVIEIPAADDVAAILKGMQAMLQAQAAEIQELKARAPAPVQETDDLTESMLFLARPNGEPWEERIIVDGKTRLIEGRRTAFFGPFDNQSQIDQYLEAKRNKRSDGMVDWQTVYALSGRDARNLRQKERQEIRKKFGGSPAVNMLDRRMRPALDVMTGALDRQPGIGVAIEARDY